MEIPARVFSKLDQYPDDKYLTGIKKHVVFVDIPCEWGRIYQEKLQTIANSFAFQKNYDLTILPAGPKCMSERKDCSTWITKILVDELTCNVEDENTCPSDWANSYCGNGTCIVNPNTREIVVDYSQDINQLPVLLEAYENWEDTVLLPLEK